jgi:hypothetical protein
VLSRCNSLEPSRSTPSKFVANSRQLPIPRGRNIYIDPCCCSCMPACQPRINSLLRGAHRGLTSPRRPLYFAVIDHRFDIVALKIVSRADPIAPHLQLEASIASSNSETTRQCTTLLDDSMYCFYVDVDSCWLAALSKDGPVNLPCPASVLSLLLPALYRISRQGYYT